MEEGDIWPSLGPWRRKRPCRDLAFKRELQVPMFSGEEKKIQKGYWGELKRGEKMRREHAESEWRHIPREETACSREREGMFRKRLLVKLAGAERRQQERTIGREPLGPPSQAQACSVSPGGFWHGRQTWTLESLWCGGWTEKDGGRTPSQGNQEGGYWNDLMSGHKAPQAEPGWEGGEKHRDESAQHFSKTALKTVKTMAQNK